MNQSKVLNRGRITNATLGLTVVVTCFAVVATSMAGMWSPTAVVDQVLPLKPPVVRPDQVKAQGKRASMPQADAIHLPDTIATNAEVNRVRKACDRMGMDLRAVAFDGDKPVLVCVADLKPSNT